MASFKILVCSPITLSALALTFVALGLAACGGGSSDATDSSDLTAYEGPIQSEDTEAGKVAFEDACSACHSEESEPLANIGWPVAKVRKQIREGDAEMPAIPENRLSDADMENLLAFLATMGTIK